MSSQAATDAFHLVATVIGELLEDAEPVVLRSRGEGETSNLVDQLQRLGAEISALAAAMEVLLRRAE